MRQHLPKIIGALTAFVFSAAIGAFSFHIIPVFKQSYLKEKPQVAENNPVAESSGRVLAAEDIQNSPKLSINLPAFFSDTTEFQEETTFTKKVNLQDEVEGSGVRLNLDDASEVVSGSVTTGTLTAENIIYSITVGEGLSITEGQEPVITNLDKGSDQSIYSTFKVNGSSVTAGSNEDVFELVEGDNMSLSLDSGSKKVTFSSSAPLIWTSSGDNIYYNSGNVGIKNIDPQTALDVTGTITAEGLKLTDGAQAGYYLKTDVSGNASWVKIGSEDAPWSLDGSTVTLDELNYNVGIGTTNPNAQVNIVANSTDQQQLVLQGVAGQTANALEIHDEDGNANISFDKEGNANFAGTITQEGFALSGNGLNFTGDATSVSLDASTPEPDNLFNNGLLEDDLSEWNYTKTKKEKFSNNTLETNLDSWETNGTQASAWYGSSWEYRKKITFNNSDQTEDLSEFPVLIKLEEGVNIAYDKIAANGADIRFTDSDGTTELSYEIEEWNEGATSYVWVEVPQIDGASDTDYIYMYYGNDAASNGEDADGVWNANYVGVWHLKEDPSGAEPQIQDSTGNNNDGSSRGSMTSEDQMEGEINGSIDFAGDDDYLTFGTETANFDTADPFTFEGWVKIDASSNQAIISKKRVGGTHNGYNLNYDGNNKKFYFQLARDDYWNAEIYVRGSTEVSAGTDTWYYVVGTYDGSGTAAGTQIFVNGDGETEEIVIDAMTGSFSPTSYNFQISGRSGGSLLFDGQIDEVRVSNNARSADWIAATYKSVKNTFVSYGDEQSAGSGLVMHETDTTYDSSSGSVVINATGDNTNLRQAINLISTETFNLEAYAYTDGSEVTADDVQLYYNDAAIITSYTNMGSGWYKLSAEVTGANADRTVGALVKHNAQVYLDSFSLQISDTSNKVVHETTTTYGSSSGSGLIDAIGLEDLEFNQEITVAVNGTHTFSVYVYNNTPGTIGGTVDSSVVELNHEGSNISNISYTDQGNGWWKVEGSKSLTTGSNTFGVNVKTDKSVYIDNLQVVAGRGETKTITIQNTGSGLAKLVVESTTTLNTGLDSENALVLKGVENQQADLMQWKDYENNILGVIDQDGNLGVGTSDPGYKLQVGEAGDGTVARANAWETLSDASLKTNIDQILDPLGKIDEMRGVRFDWVSTQESSIGFIAQELEKVMPEVVSTGEDGYKSINYQVLTALLTEGIKQQQQEIEFIQKHLGLKTDFVVSSTSNYSDLNATSSAQLDKLIVTDLGVTGEITNGVVNIDGLDGEINALGSTLRLQSLPGAGSLDVFKGKIVLNPNGDIEITEGVLKANDSMRGKVELEEDVEGNKIEVEKEWEESPVSINLTPSWDTNVWVTELNKNGFVINFSKLPENAEEKQIYWTAIW